METIDCRGLACPKPVILTKKKLESIKGEDAIVTTIVDNKVAKQNIIKLGESMGCTYSIEEKDGLFYVTLNRKSPSVNNQNKENGLVIFIGTDKLGSGDDELGAALMKSYMFALSESDQLPKTILFVNGGVKLTTEGSQVLDSINKLVSRGVEVLSCGTCLDFYNLKEKLKAGDITNMYAIVEKMNNATNTIKL
jgi:selenium metabolism protein YedF